MVRQVAANVPPPDMALVGYVDDIAGLVLADSVEDACSKTDYLLRSLVG